MINDAYVSWTVTLSHVTFMNESCHIWMRHVTRWITSRHVTMNDQCRVYGLHRDHESCHVYGSVMSHMNASRYTVNIFKACHYKWSMSCIWATPWPWVTSRVRMSHVTYQCVMSLDWELECISLWMIYVAYISLTVTMSHITCMSESCHVCQITRWITWRHHHMGWLRSVGSIKL